MNPLNRDTHRFPWLPVLLILAGMLALLPGCDDPASSEDPPVDEWGWDALVPHIELNRPAQLFAGMQVGTDVVLCGEYTDTQTGFVLRATVMSDLQWLVELTRTPTSIDIADNGDILLAGQTNSGAAWFARYAADGTLIHQTSFDNLDARSVCATVDGGLLFAAEKNDGIELLKFDQNSQEQWHNTIEGELPFTVADLVALDTGYLLAGSGGMGEFAIPWLLTETDDAGDVVHQFAISGTDTVVAAVMLANGDRVTAGMTVGDPSNVRVMRTGTAGELIWNVEIPAMVELRSLRVLDDGRIAVTGLDEQDGRSIPQVSIIDEAGNAQDTLFTLQLWDTEDEFMNESVLYTAENENGNLVTIGVAPLFKEFEMCVYFRVL